MKSSYISAVKYTQAQQVAFIKSDLLNDAENAERQAQNGPFYPERNITAATLRAYAEDCRAIAAKQFTPDQFIKNQIP